MKTHSEMTSESLPFPDRTPTSRFTTVSTRILGPGDRETGPEYGWVFSSKSWDLQ